MGKTLIRVKCVDQRLFVSETPIIASGGRNEDEVEFNFCPLWDGFEKVAVFYRDRRETYHAVISENRCVIPHEVLKSDGLIYFGVFGVKEDITRTSEIAKYRIVKGAITEGTNPSDPTPDIYAQYVERINRLEKFATGSDPYAITGNPVQLENFEGMPMDVVQTFTLTQSGSGDPYPAGGKGNLLPATPAKSETVNGITVTSDGYGRYAINGTAETGVAVTWDLAQPVTFEGGAVYAHLLNSEVNGNIAIAFLNNGAQIAYTTCSFTTNRVAELPALSGATITSIKFNIPGGTACNNVMLSPMLRRDDTATEFAPYSNIRPISGCDKLELTRCGKNLVNSAPSQSTTTSGITFSASADGYGTNVKGTSSADWAQNPREYYDTLSLPPGTYTFSRRLVGSVNGANVNFMIRVNGKNDGTVGSASKTYTFAEQTEIGFFVYVAESGKTVDCTVYLQIELGSVSTPFEPYRSDTYTAHLGDTVHGGTYDWNKGELVAEWLHVRMADQNWTASTNYPGRFSINAVGAYARRVAPICNIMPGWAGFSPDLRYTLMNNEGDQLIIITDFTSLDQLITWLDENDAYACCKLATPITIQLTPQQIIALAGVNTLYSDVGEMTVSGRKDILWLTSYLLRQNAELTNAIISLGGNV